jgi:phosphoribosylformylglycinamidine synthase
VPDHEYFIKAFSTIQELILQGKVLAGHDISAGGMVTTLLEMCFANCDHGMELDFTQYEENDFIRLMFSEHPGVIIQVEDTKAVTKELLKQSLDFHVIGKVIEAFKIDIREKEGSHELDINRLRDVWFATSYMFDKVQSGEGPAHCRLKNYRRQDLHYYMGHDFTGKASDYGIKMSRRKKSGTRAAIIREKGVNGDREMAYALHLAGFDVKDVHMTDLISGREDLTDVNFIVFVGGFSNSDVLGSAKGWAGAFLYNEKAKKALDNFYAREDTLSLGVCNGCQLMIELGLIYPDHPEKPRMLHNDSGKFESGFVNVDIHENDSVMLKSLAGSRLGIWVAHGEGKFSFPCYLDNYNLAITYSYDIYPGNPNGSDWATAGICSNNGRHLAMMPHLERSFLPWQWPYYPEDRKDDEVTPWIEAFVNARKWVEKF